MSNDSKHYFVFSKDHRLYKYWVEIIGTYSPQEAMDVFYMRYDERSHPKDPSILKFHTKGCYEQIHLPLPDDIRIDSDDPYFSKPKKRDDFIWAVIGQTGAGKSWYPANNSQMMGRINRAGQSNNKILILDDYKILLDSKKINNIHHKINTNVTKSMMRKMKKISDDLGIDYGWVKAAVNHESKL